MHQYNASELSICPQTHQVPWAVTANVAFKNPTIEFDTRFPKTGGGEDIDFCLRVAPEGLVSVPEVKAC